MQKVDPPHISVVVVVVVDIFLFTTQYLVRKCYKKGSTRKISHRCDLLISIVDFTFNGYETHTMYRDTCK